MISETLVGQRQSLMAGAFSPARAHGTAIFASLIALFFAGAIFVPNFASTNNVAAILYMAAPIGVVAVGLALITLSGNLFILSLSMTAALSSIIFAAMMPLGIPVALLAAVLMGATVGVAQGVVVVKFGTNPIITSIAAASLIGAAGQYLSGGRTILADGNISWLGSGSLVPGIPYQALIFVALVIIADFFVERSRMGRELRLTGMNSAAATLAGLRSTRVSVLAYLFAGATAAAAGIMIGAQSGAGNMRVGQDLDFSAIAAVLIGGVAIKGGKGRIIDAAVGAVFIAVLTNILLVCGFSYEFQLMVKGLAVIASVILGAASVKEKN